MQTCEHFKRARHEIGLKVESTFLSVVFCGQLSTPRFLQAVVLFVLMAICVFAKKHRKTNNPMGTDRDEKAKSGCCDPGCAVALFVITWLGFVVVSPRTGV